MGAVEPAPQAEHGRRRLFAAHGASDGQSELPALQSGRLLDNEGLDLGWSKMLQPRTDKLRELEGAMEVDYVSTLRAMPHEDLVQAFLKLHMESIWPPGKGHHFPRRSSEIRE